jgi:RNA polymerase sigma factor (sigma-70 family)
VTAPRALEDVWRDCAPTVLGALVRRYRDFDRAEDAAQEAVLAAARQWPVEGLPENPRAWLITVASRRLVDQLRADHARADRESRVSAAEPDGAVSSAYSADAATTPDHDDSLALLILCCHPALSPASQVALTLRAVGGLTTAQIARAFLVPEATMAQRISRAKASLRRSGARFAAPSPSELPVRVAATSHVLYLIFTEGHTATAGAALMEVSLADEAIRLARRLSETMPRADEVSGLLALMLLTHARRAARTGDDGSLVTLADQDRSRWDTTMIAEGVGIVEAVLPTGPVGPYQLQAAIAAVHAEAPTAAATDWVQIESLYGMLDAIAPSAVVTLNHAVAVSMAYGPHAALAMVEPLLDDRQVRRHHRLHAVYGHVLERAGRRREARDAYAAAARLATSIPEQRHLNDQAARLDRNDEIRR